MSVQTEKSLLIDLLQNINDASIIQKVKNFVLHEIEPAPLSDNQKKELDRRITDHRENPKSGVDAFEFLDSLKSKYEL
ncbi:addiction module protein [Flavobacterium sp. FBOR7N2.3]|uniref:Addiction module protein n=1 Tax=Flavobacterium magnesitis TaxID=3138077 RepID=A0ABV4TQF6_9FLAO